MLTDPGAAYLVRRAAEHAADYLASLPERPVVATATADEVAARLGGPLPEDGEPAPAVLERLLTEADAGITASGSGRFFGFVVGGALPVGVAADVAAAAWDQNCGLRVLAPAAAAAEQVAAQWLLDLLGLPSTAQVGLVPGGMSANFTGLAAARHAVLAAAGWDVESRGLLGGPRVHVLVNAERHETVDRALRFLGLGAPTPVAVDAEGRMRPDALAAALAEVPAGAPLIVCLYSGHIHTGQHDPYEQLIPLVHDRGGWVHVDGAIGLWAAACARLRHLTAGLATADSWATDAHKTLNVPYDCGIVIVADTAALAGAMGIHASYVVHDGSGQLEAGWRVPEWSRRGRAFPVWAVLRHLGRQGVDDLVARLHDHAVAMAAAVAAIPGVEVRHDVVATQLSFTVGDEARTAAVVDHILRDGRTWISGSRWQDRPVVRVSVSNWSTDAEDIALAARIVREAMAATT
ncbi:MAG: pyridoxal phosphate-dependent decarboxylase family protein [Kineosporiaceae bacterium]